MRVSGFREGSRVGLVVEKVDCDVMGEGESVGRARARMGD